MNILIIEDDKKLAQFIQKGLKSEGYQASIVHSAVEALEICREAKFDLIVLDLMLPQMDGVSFLKIFRQKDKESLVLILTARDEISLKREAFHAGADDYVVKPFEFEELLLRIRALIRRMSVIKENHIIQVADLRINLHSHSVERGGRRIELSSREFALLEYLMRNAGRVLSRALIFDNVWGIGFETDTNLVDVYIKNLRKKIDQDFDKKLIHTVRGMGYVLKDRDEI